MAAPVPTVYGNGVQPVTGDQFNTFVQGLQNTTQLRGFIGAPGMSVELQGISVPNDGGAGFFYWNPASTAPDDNYNVIVPNATNAGAWNRLGLFPSAASLNGAIGLSWGANSGVVVPDTYTLIGYAPYAGTITMLEAIVGTKGGGLTETVAVNGTPVTGCSGVSVTSAAKQAFQATGFNTFNIGDRISLQFSIASGAPVGAWSTVLFTKSGSPFPKYNFINNGTLLQLINRIGWPTSPVGLVPGQVWANGVPDTLVSVVPGVTPNPLASPVYFGGISSGALLALGGGNLPLTNPGAGSLQLWNNGGLVCVA